MTDLERLQAQISVLETARAAAIKRLTEVCSENITLHNRIDWLVKVIRDAPGRTCARKLDCGSDCFLPYKHEGPCLCVGDVAAEPEGCPA